MHKRIKILLLMLIAIALVVMTASYSALAGGLIVWSNSTITDTGGRLDIDFGSRSSSMEVMATFSESTMIIYYDNLWQELWSGSFDGGISHRLILEANVQYVSIFLDNDKSVEILPMALTVWNNAQITKTGGRLNVDVGNHSQAMVITAHFTDSTYAIYYDNSWQEVWAGSFGSGADHQLIMNEAVRYISIFLDEQKTVSLLPGTPINETTFPDPAFRNAILNKYSVGNGYVNLSTTSILVYSEGIQDLAGIEYYPNLIFLSCEDNQLTSLDMSGNPLLQGLNCDNNALTSLSVQTNRSLTYLECSNNHLQSLDISNNIDLISLEISNNQLLSLDVSHNPKLTMIRCDDNQISSIDVSQNQKLISLDCGGNQLTSLDVTHNAELAVLECDYNQLKSVDISHNSGLSVLKCDYNQLTVLDISSNLGLGSLWCSYNQLTSIDISNHVHLEELSCSGNQLTLLNLSNQSLLFVLRCEDNQLSELDLSNNPRLDMRDSEITPLNPVILSPQNHNTINASYENGAYKVNLRELPHGQQIDFSRVYMTDGGNLNSSLGIVSYNVKPNEVRYKYYTENDNYEYTMYMHVVVPISPPEDHLYIRRVISPSSATLSNTPQPGGIDGTITATVPYGTVAQLIDIEPSLSDAQWKIFWYNDNMKYVELDNKTLPLVVGNNTAFLELSAPEFNTLTYLATITRLEPTAWEDIPHLKPGCIQYHSDLYDGLKKETVSFEDILFNTKATEYSRNLSYVASLLSAAAYRTTEKDEVEYQNEYRAEFKGILADYNIRVSLENLGFEEIFTDHYFDEVDDPIYPQHAVAYSIASKRIFTDEGTKILVAVVLRGTDGGFPSKDWLSNMDIFRIIELPTKHNGFNIAMEYVYTILKDYYCKLFNPDDIKFLITGHSRGGAVANLLAVKISDDSFVAKEDVYCYTFASPDVEVGVSTTWNWWGAHDNIHNICNAGDIVPYLPGVSGCIIKSPILQWGKFGRKYWFWDGNTLPSSNNPHFMDGYIAQVRDYSSPGSNLNPISFLGKYISGIVLCPVDVEIYNKDGILVGKIKNNQITLQIGSGGRLFVINNEKIYMLDDHEYTIKFIGSGVGTMTFVTGSFDMVERTTPYNKSFENVELFNGKMMISRIGAEIGINDLQLFVVDAEGSPIAEILPDGTEVPITGKLEIIQQPQDTIVAIDHQATFTVQAVGIEPISYQWYINRNNSSGWVLPKDGTQKVYISSPVSLDNDGYRYYCRITDATKAIVDSEIATLSVATSPQTGDDTNLIGILSLALLAVAGIGGLLLYKRYKAGKKDKCFQFQMDHTER